ncbi:hypothetical protein F5J12DRAFT_78084 [Pisolithus orientalis]|uniref:uncharacterized protein n=1 Tax=Pisolithus orientalis TaxID=936130 RepID=UPI002224B24B|nr:uncharacterized protein F5J12DRAFT_78084 [Pisolithus orientalis]KAI5984392.1 hypothetical protein F5J12DRAFT_78084 [Pisolithus orientalis]
MSLESPICDLRDSVRNVVGTIAAETQTHTARSWRVDSDAREEDAVFPSKMQNIRDRIIKWQESQKYSEDVPPRTSSPAAVRPAREGPSIPDIVRLGEGEDTTSPPASEMFDTIPTLLQVSQMSCSCFADTSEANDDRMFSWLLDRKVLPKSLAFDPKFFHDEYIAMTGFIWPMTWNVRDNLPPVDAALEPCIQELLASVAILKSRNAVKLFHPDEFPFDLRILEQCFSAIFQAPRRSREKKVIGDEYEVSWRHDHDRFLFDFFIRLVQVDAGTLLGGDKPVAHLEDLQVRPTCVVVDIMDHF